MTLNINGQSHELDVLPNMPLLWALRDVAHLTGTKYGCGMALCGACTVHLDGKPVRSCMTPVSAAAGKKIVTIEAISADRVGKAKPRCEEADEGGEHCSDAATGVVAEPLAHASHRRRKQLGHERAHRREHHQVDVAEQEPDRQDHVVAQRCKQIHEQQHH